jgi:FAD/FMN-containing dehydrogenase
LKVSRGQTVDVEVRYHCRGSQAREDATAALVIRDSGGSRAWLPMRARLSARIGSVKTTLPRTANITAGERASIPITVEWVAGPDTTVSYKAKSRSGHGISNTPLEVPLRKGARVTTTLELVALAGTPAGEHTVIVESSAFDGQLVTPTELEVIVRSPRRPAADACRLLEDVSQGWARDDQTWRNWGIVDLPATFLGYLPTPKLFRPTTVHEVARAIKEAEAANTTIRALGSGWSFSDAVLPQSSPMDGGEGATPRSQGLSGALDDGAIAEASSGFSRHFGYAMDTSGLDRSLQSLLPGVITDARMLDSLFFTEAGMTISFLNTLLDSQAPRMALKTMGGASGQTIAGAFSTGTHGSDFDRAPLADSVRAIYLVGAGGGHHWIEPATRITDPAKIRSTFPCIPAANIHYDDDLFRAVLVSMGAMGVIYAVVLDVVPQYSLLQFNRWSTWEDLKAALAPDFAELFDGSWTGIDDHLRERLATENPPAPRFAQVVINPMRNQSDGKHRCYVTNRVELPLQQSSGTQPPGTYTDIPIEELIDAIQGSPEFGHHETIHFAAALAHGDLGGDGDPLLERLRKVLAFCKERDYPWAVATAINRVMQLTFPQSRIPAAPSTPPGAGRRPPDGGRAQPEPGERPEREQPVPHVDVGYRVMTSGSTDRYFPPLGATSIESAFSFYSSVPSPDQPGLRVVVPDAISFIDRVLAVLDEGIASEEKLFPAGWLSLRITGRTAALLGMQQFDRSAMVELSLVGTPDAYAIVRRIEELTRAEGGQLHWGQSNGLMTPSDLEFLYRPSTLEKWRAAQRALGGDTFTNYFMQRCGLVAVPLIKVEPAHLRFGIVRVGDVSQPKPIRITNVGSGDLDVSLAASNRVFLWSGLSTVLPPGGAVTVDVEFAPQSAGLQSRTLALHSNAPGSPHPVALSGSGTMEQNPL